MKQSRFANRRGILFAADLPNESQLYRLLEEVGTFVDALTLGNSLLYEYGARLIEKLKRDFPHPIIADLKLTDVSHISTRVVTLFRDCGTDAIIVAGVCGEDVLADAVVAAGTSCEIWAFTEFTNDSGLIDVALADQTVSVALRSGVLGLQVPGTRPYRIEDVRSEVGEGVTIVACGIGAQGGRFGSAIAAGATLEIVGRAIYAARFPAEAAKEAYLATRCA